VSAGPIGVMSLGRVPRVVESVVRDPSAAPLSESVYHGFVIVDWEVTN
jgi:hypothetical protein